MPGQMKASTPNTMAQMPFSKRSHQFLASAWSMGRPNGGVSTVRDVAMMSLQSELRDDRYRLRQCERLPSLCGLAGHGVLHDADNERHDGTGDAAAHRLPQYR